MGREIDELRDKIHGRILILRSIENSLALIVVDDLWKESSFLEKEKLRRVIEVESKIGVRNWIRRHPSRDISEWSIVELRQQAALWKFPGWSRMSKIELIRAINTKENN